ncbi:unnamed protein product [Cladocopium goreaui]|uniref:Uncharacterized protein n=1 Tax=Cladocopium goreaui TaxID=2562237 RepID=A0A9P1BMR1_9DINO|nr:unnamed protein product [Cladocopium goreaui]
MQSSLRPVDSLSDEENTNDNPGPQPKIRSPRPRAPARGRRKGSFAKVHFGRHDSPKHLANLIRGSCGCKALCFSAYREHQIQEWLKLRKQLGGMTKLEKDQYVRMHVAAQKGQEHCPYDGRFVVKGKQTPSDTWDRVHMFLTQLYMEAAEPIPDGLNSNKRPRQGSKKRDSPHLDRSKMKHLPYGTISDYYRQCVWQSDFEHLLRIRFYTHHSKCSLCIKHRLIIKKLGHCPPARRAQHAMLQKHLDRQHKDRQVYYAARARSRLGATTLGECEITAILDSMDAQKHAWPRSRCMSSKEFSNFNRPRLTSTTLLVHGHLVLVALSPSLLTTGSSRTAEIICHGLSKLADTVDFSIGGPGAPHSIRLERIGSTGDDPFDMHAAAQQLEDLSYGFVDQTFLDVSWALPQLGGAVGRSAWPVVQGRDLEAVMGKRKSEPASGKAAGAVKAKAAKKGSGVMTIPADAMKLPHIKLYDTWARENLTQKNLTIDLQYSTDADIGQEVQHALCQLQLLNGLQTDPNKPGTEKMVGSFSVIHATAVESDSNLIVNTNRVSLGGQLRRRPNAFNLLHQLEFLERSGVSRTLSVMSLQAHESVSQFAQAYALGEKESNAAVIHTQPKFVNHDGLAEGLLNHGYCSASGFLLPWRSYLSNSQGLLNLLIARMEIDWVAMSPKQRKPWNVKDLTQLQRVCGGFLACLEQFHSSVPEKFANSCLSEIHRFELRHGDADILLLLETTVPRTSRRLSAQLLHTTWQQTELQIETDLSQLREWSQKFELYVNKQGSLDYKYINDRYIRGRAAIDTLLSKKHTFMRCSSLVLAHAPIVQQQAELGKGLASGNVNTLSFWTLDSYELSLNYSDAVHQGLAGVSANHTSTPWAKSRSLLGTITGIERSRVQVQQRGIKATRDILLKLLDGMHESDRQKVLVVDMVPSRFSEWSQACWELQRDALLNEPDGNKWDFHFMAIYHDDEGHHMESNRELVTGRAMSQWWDKVDESGPPARACEPFSIDVPAMECLTISENEVKMPDLITQKFTATHKDHLQKITEKITHETAVHKALRMASAPPSSSSGANGVGQSRTMAGPEWGSDEPVNWSEACAPLAREPNLELVLTSAGSLWIVNRTTNRIDLAAGELFGFNTGTFIKKLTTVAEAMCDVTRLRGITEIRMVDHSLNPKMKVAPDGSQIPMCFRYKVVPDSKINCFRPKDLTAADKSNLRGAVFGALWSGKYGQLPNTPHCSVTWEAWGCQNFSFISTFLFL